MIHPYKTQPTTAFWSRSVSKDWSARQTYQRDVKLLRTGDKVASLGSCFAANLVPYLRKNGFDYVETEQRHPSFKRLPIDNFSYDKFSAAYGNIYTARQFRQLLARAYDGYRPKEDRWHIDGEVVDPFRPGLLYRARSDAEFDALTARHLACVRKVFETANVVIFTLGLTEAWLSKLDGAVFPACPGTVAGEFDPDKHAFYNFTVAEIVSDLDAIYQNLKTIRPDLRLILTVSPVPLVATATQQHVLVASTYSKSVLRVCCGEICERHPEISYFPSYEIITGPQAPETFFKADRRDASEEGVGEVMAAFLSHCDGREARSPRAVAATPEVAEELSNIITTVECEEAAADA